MEKPESCPDCGGMEFKLESIPVTADMTALYDADGNEANLPFHQRSISFRVDAWCCENCDHADVDEEYLQKHVQQATQKILNRAIAELN